MPEAIHLAMLSMLADGEFHSGEKLAKEFQLSRTAIWKAIQALQDQFGLDIFAVTGRGYRLAEAIELLNHGNLLEQIHKHTDDLDVEIHVFSSLDSTNQFLLDQEFAQKGYQVCLAEMQKKGRGRRGRSWTSPFAKNIQMSLSTVTEKSMSDISGLSVAMGVTVAESLHDFGLDNIALKWPNDLYVESKKLGGLLLEVRGEAEGPVKVVAGLGLNVDMSGVDSVEIDQPFIDLKQTVIGDKVSRNELIAKLIVDCCNAIELFEKNGLQDFIERWKKFDVYWGQQVTLSNAVSTITGEYQGIDRQGGLILKNANGINTYHAGELSLRRND